jgi:hypothetical protein
MRFTPKRLGTFLAGTAILATGFIAVGATAASAQQSTTTSVIGKPVATISGEGIELKAQVTFTPIKRSPLAGTITFSAVDNGGNAVELSCNKGDAPSVSPKGKAICYVPGGILFSGVAPYTITATFASTNPNFDGSFGSTTAAPTIANTKIGLRMNPRRVKSGDAAVAIATVTAGKGTKGLSGTVTFGITSGDSKVPLKCTNSTSSKGVQVPLTGKHAQCDLAAGWVLLPTAKHAKTTWTVTAFFTPTSSSDYVAPPAFASKRGNLVHH